MDPAVIGSVAQWVGALGTTAAVGYVLYRDYWKRPKLTLSFDKDKDVKDQVNTVGLPTWEDSRWLLVRVHNANGRRAARNCRAFLIGIEAVGQDNKLVDVFPNDVRQLRWTHSPPEPTARDLLPGVVHSVDLLAALKRENHLRVQVDPAWTLQIPGKYVLTVQVSAEDTESKVIKVPVECGGTWDTLKGIDVG